MKLNFGKRLVFFLHWLLSVIAVVLAACLCIWPDFVYGLFDMAYAAIGKNTTNIIGAAVLAVYVLLAVLTVVFIFSDNQKRHERGFITVDSSDSGKTRIAVGAVEQMIRQAVRMVEGITEIKTNIINQEDAISINVNVTISSGAHIPTVTANIQRAIRSYIELNCGVAVRAVSVSVHAVDGLEKDVPVMSAEPPLGQEQTTAEEPAIDLPIEDKAEENTEENNGEA